MNKLRDPFNALVSYAFFRTRVPEIKVHHDLGMRFIGDSGAYSAHTQGKIITLDAYADWLTDLAGRLVWCASLDVIGNPEATWVNFIRLRATGHQVVPTIHVGTDIRELDRYVDRGCDLIGLGGMAKRKDPKALMRWLVPIFRYARDVHPQVRFHGWGMTRREILMHLPFWSVDSSGFGQVYRFGRLDLFDQTTGRRVTFHMNKGHTLAAGGEHFRDRLGITPAEVAKIDIRNATPYHPTAAESAGRSLLYGVAAHLAQDTETYYTRRHHVSPPSSLSITYPKIGTLVHFADGDPLVFKGIRAHVQASQPALGPS